MENNIPITDHIRSIASAKQALVADPAAPVSATKEEIIREIQEKYPSFSHFDIENAFEQLKIDHHLQELEPDMFVFTQEFVSNK